MPRRPGTDRQPSQPSSLASDIGMMTKGNIGPNGRRLPDPDVLLLSYTGCFTFMKWFELVRQKYDCETVMLHVPYQGDGKINPAMREYVVKQLNNIANAQLDRQLGLFRQRFALLERVALDTSIPRRVATDGIDLKLHLATLVD